MAYMGLGAGVKEDIIYPTAFVDGNGEPLDGAYNYVTSVSTESSYRRPRMASGRYRRTGVRISTCARFARTVRAAAWKPEAITRTGSIDIYLQAKSPGADKESNWLSDTGQAACST